MIRKTSLEYLFDVKTDVNELETRYFVTVQYGAEEAKTYQPVTSAENVTAIRSAVKKVESKKKVPDGQLPRKYKIDQLTKKLDEEYFKQIKQTDKIPKNSNKIFEELEMYKQKVNDIKQINRDEELLRMQKENQEIEEKLYELKQQDNSELKEKQESCRKLVD